MAPSARAPSGLDCFASLDVRQVVGAMSEGVVVQHADGTIHGWNPRAEEILGLSGDQLSGRTSTDPRWRSIRPDGTPFPGEEHPAMITLRTGRPVWGALMGVHKPDGTLTWIN
ncbi:MAG TPA: PAS domain-containing protein, partial [Gemmatimonadaceae bacterium]|nr:PAS domain-containing protein [Gemmatimonadaceae bacterium]